MLAMTSEVIHRGRWQQDWSGLCMRRPVHTNTRVQNCAQAHADVCTLTATHMLAAPVCQLHQPLSSPRFSSPLCSVCWEKFPSPHFTSDASHTLLVKRTWLSFIVVLGWLPPQWLRGMQAGFRGRKSLSLPWPWGKGSPTFCQEQGQQLFMM